MWKISTGHVVQIYIARFRSSLSNFMKQRPSSKALKVGSLHLIQPKVQSSRSRNSVTGTPPRVGEMRFTTSYRGYFRVILILSSRSCTYFTEDAQWTWQSNYEVGSQWFDSRTNQCASRHSPCRLRDSYIFLLNVYDEVSLARVQSRQSVSLTIELHILPGLRFSTVLLQPLSVPL
jgi:hypothetical protein